MNKSIFRHLYLLIILLVLIRCGAQDFDSNQVKGNWQVHEEYNKIANYQEIYFDSVNAYYYDYNLGLRPVAKYHFKGDDFYESELGGEFEFIGKVNIVNDILYIKNRKNEVRFKKINDFNNLEKFIRGKINKEKYWDSYLKRYKSWENKPY
jgi:hypothetical protein